MLKLLNNQKADLVAVWFFVPKRWWSPVAWILAVMFRRSGNMGISLVAKRGLEGKEGKADG